MRTAARSGHESLATKADLYQVALAIVVANAAITFGLLKLIQVRGHECSGTRRDRPELARALNGCVRAMS